MEASDKPWFKGQVDMLAINFRQEISPPLYHAMWAGLEDINKANVETAIKRALRECEFMPVVATLRDLAGHKKKGIEPPYWQPLPMTATEREELREERKKELECTCPPNGTKCINCEVAEIRRRYGPQPPGALLGAVK